MIKTQHKKRCVRVKVYLIAIYAKLACFDQLSISKKALDVDDGIFLPSHLPKIVYVNLKYSSFESYSHSNFVYIAHQ